MNNEQKNKKSGNKRIRTLIPSVKNTPVKTTAKVAIRKLNACASPKACAAISGFNL